MNVAATEITDYKKVGDRYLFVEEMLRIWAAFEKII